MLILYYLFIKIATFSLTVIKLAEITVFICLFPVGDPVWSQIENKTINHLSP